MKTEGRKCISIVDHLETDVAIKLPQFHAVIVCYTTSFLHGFGKLKFLKVSKLIRKTKPCKTFAVLCKVSQTAAKDVENCLLLWMLLCLLKLFATLEKKKRVAETRVLL